MANFLITSPNSLETGTDSNDLFVLNTALSVTVNAGGGADEISAAAEIGANFTNAYLQGGQGNDSIFLTANGLTNLTLAKFAAGAGSDLIAIDLGSGTDATIIGGGGNDTIQFSGGTYTAGEINGNLGDDLITASGTTFVSAVVGLGAGADTINLNFGSAHGSTINGGGGTDVLIFSGVGISGSRIEGDTLGDSQFFGDDTIRFLGAGTLTGTTVNGGQGNDLVDIDQVISTGARIEGNQGNDSIFLSSTRSTGAIFLGAGAGNDTITVSAVLVDDFGTIQGGGGTDVINVSAVGANSGFIFGGAAADQINLGTLLGATANALASGEYVAYSAFSESNFAAFDTISASVAAGTTGAFMISQEAVNFTAIANGTKGGGSTEFTVSGGVARGFAAATQTLTARAEALDANLTQGQAVVFANSNGQNYLFVQGGAQVSGLDNDMLVQLNGMSFGANTGGSVVAGNSQLKVVFE